MVRWNWLIVKIPIALRVISLWQPELQEECNQYTERDQCHAVADFHDTQVCPILNQPGETLRIFRWCRSSCTECLRHDEDFHSLGEIPYSKRMPLRLGKQDLSISVARRVAQLVGLQVRLEKSLSDQCFQPMAEGFCWTKTLGQCPLWGTGSRQ